ncbi:MAG: ornithine carbamoyltransferase [Chitinivibrionales bacterium]|nr:ornithine carbamoyltransferase [Chitinivibrionales bacterium]
MLKKDLRSLLDYSPDTIEQLLISAGTLKANRPHARTTVFKDKTGVLLFEKPSLRTRITFETAINELGGHAINLPAESVQMGKRESVSDVAKNLERWVHLLVVRTFSHATLTQLADACSIPIINALTDADHPCQALAFALTLRERFGEARDCPVAFVGDGNNVCHALMILAAKLGYDFTAACPPGYEPNPGILASCQAFSRKTGKRLAVVRDPAAAVRDAAVVYTDVWTSMGQEQETAQRKKIFAPFQVNAALMAQAPAAALVSHCLPAHRGEEITGDILDGERCIALDEAENRLHVQKAVIVHLFS